LNEANNFSEVHMPGTPNRSGGRNRKASSNAIGDGIPLSPRALSPRASALYGWILDKLKADDPASGWRRIDGCLLASFAELLESQEAIASQLSDDPSNLGLMRLRLQYVAQISRMSAVIGMSPIDRERLPQAAEATVENPLTSIMERMRRG